MSNIDKVKVGNTIYPIADSRIGNLTNLDTTEKNTLVGAINEVIDDIQTASFVGFTVSGEKLVITTEVTDADEVSY